MIKVMTDNAANLPPELRAQYGITELCLTYTIDGEPVDISKPFDGHAFYEAMRKGAEVKTSMITPLAAREAMEPVLDRGDDVLYVGAVRRCQRHLLGRQRGGAGAARALPRP